MSILITTCVAAILLVFDSRDSERIQDQSIADLIGNLTKADPETKLIAAEKLLRLGPKANGAVPHLEIALTDADVRVRLAAARALSKIAPTNTSSFPVLLSLLKNEQETMREGAAEILPYVAMSSADRAKRAAAAKGLVEIAKDSNEGVRCHCAIALGKMTSETESVLPALVALLGDQNELVRVFAAQAIGGLGPPAKDAVMNLVQVVQKDVKARSAAIQALGALGPGAESAIPALINELAHGEEENRRYAAQSLGNIGPKAVIALPALRHAESSMDFRLGSVASEAIKKIEIKTDQQDAKKKRWHHMLWGVNRLARAKNAEEKDLSRKGVIVICLGILAILSKTNHDDPFLLMMAALKNYQESAIGAIGEGSSTLDNKAFTMTLTVRPFGPNESLGMSVIRVLEGGK